MFGFASDISALAQHCMANPSDPVCGGSGTTPQTMIGYGNNIATNSPSTTVNVGPMPGYTVPATPFYAKVWHDTPPIARYAGLALLAYLAYKFLIK